MPTVFVIRPFDKKKHAASVSVDAAGKESIVERETDFEAIHDQLILAAARKAGLNTAEITTKDVNDAGNIRADMFALILTAKIVMCDITIPNPNVFYELGVRHALRKKGTILIKGSPSALQTPFDLLTDRYLSYKLDAPANAVDALVGMIKATLASDRKADSPVFGMLPDLEEADPERILALPIEFSEELKRAVAGRSKGWLRLLAEDVAGRRFESVALRAIGHAQWKLEDYEAARINLEKIRDDYPDDVSSSLALANIYERLARGNRSRERLQESGNAIARALDSQRVKPRQRVEALTLRGRNEKTIWRWDFESLDTEEARRKGAMNRRLCASYAAYRKAYETDFNHYWSGLAALQMGTIFLELSRPESDEWKETFLSNDEAEKYRADVVKQVADLRVIVKRAVDGAIERLNEDHEDSRWAEISRTDLLFLTSDPADARRVALRYDTYVPKDDPFAWNAVRGQLELFSY